MRFGKRQIQLLAGAILLFAAEIAEAQEICYAYDKLGQEKGTG